MKLSRMTPVNIIEIWQPRWKDKVCLVATHKVGAHNGIVYTKTKSLPGTYYVSGEEARKHPIDTNGKIPCYAIPLNKFEQLERE